jgi:EAL domain-containing protein (putative c-di-GMP-specific phosphodiesterase class I)
LARDLHGAVGRGEIIAFYQPQFSLSTAQIVSAEALSRWQHPDLGTVSPGEFIPLAEEAHLIDEIGDEMIRLGTRAAAEWHERGITIEVAINVSLRQLVRPDWVAHLRQAISDVAVAPELITLEITETTAFTEVPDAARQLGQIAQTGVRISIDDFGSGYSSEAQVVALPATELKIDLGLVQDESAGGTERLAAAVDFGKSRCMRIVAEGVETASQLNRVRVAGADRAQGYLLGHPVPKADLESRLARIA